MKFKFLGLRPEDKSPHKYQNFTKDKIYEITWGRVNKYNPLFKEVYRADERTLVVSDTGEWIDVSRTANERYFKKV